MEIETEIECPHCGKSFYTTVYVEPDDSRNDLD